MTYDDNSTLVYYYYLQFRQKFVYFKLDANKTVFTKKQTKMLLDNSSYFIILSSVDITENNLSISY